MTNDNKQMWTGLGMDLKRHDILLNALGSIFRETYLFQKNRPEGMGFFDFVVGDIHGIIVIRAQPLLVGHIVTIDALLPTYKACS